MLKRNRLKYLMLIPVFMSPNTSTPFHNQAWQHIENKADKQEMVLKIDKFGLLINPIQEQFKKDKLEQEKKKLDERLRNQKELEKQNKNEPQWQEFVLTFYSSMNQENGFGNKTSQNKPLSRGGVANNVIPQNTKIYLDKWGEVVVNDKGSNKHFSVDTRLDVYIERETGENDREYLRRVNSYGIQRVRGYIIK